jgi:isopenicillin-N N-acyltransferase-like protein
LLLAAVTVYHASSANENSFALVGMGGFVGALTGVSDKQVGISEIGVSYVFIVKLSTIADVQQTIHTRSYPDGSFGAQSRFGVPFIFLLRDILQFDKTLDNAISRMASTRRTCDLILGVGDAKVINLTLLIHRVKKFFVLFSIVGLCAWL